MRTGARTVLMAGVAVGVLTVGTGGASAGGFAIREQSAYGQGTSYAGIAAGGALSGMFWNPAVMTQFPGINIEAVASGVFPTAKNAPSAGSTLLVFGGTGDTGDDALVPSTYASWQVAANVWVGMSFNAPFGLTVSFPDVWAGRNYAGNTSLKTYNATPSVAVRVNDWLSLGAGVQIMYSRAKLSTGLPFGPGTYAQISGDSWSYGFTAGATITPAPNTVIGIGWRSSLDLDIDGSLLVVAGPALGFAASTKVKLPDVVTVGVRHQVTDRFTALGTIEWSNWSRIGTATISSVFPAGNLPFQYSDGWFFALGGEYAYSDSLTLRAGLGYEISPITDRVRTPRLPDNDRIWTSVGLSYRMTNDLVLDLAYTHIFVDSTPINISAGSGNPWFNGLITYAGSVNSSVDIISVGARYRFNPPPPALITKG